jgi:uncharacterized protein YgiM (DUF1202 family)
MFRKSIALSVLILLVLSCIPQKTVKPEIISHPEAAAYFTGTVIRNNINIRSTSSTDGTIVGKVNDGEQVQVIQNNKGWYEIITSDKIKGWVRSDFIGTKSLSYNLKAENFSDSTLKDINVQMFIDENDPYAIIYMLLPENQYKDNEEAKNFVTKLGLQYQQKVYPGAVEIRILKKDKKSIFEKVYLSTKGAVNLKAPYLATGMPFAFELLNGNAIVIKVLVPAGLSDDELLRMSQDISANYGDDIRKIEIYFVEDNTDGRNYLAGQNMKPQDSSTCRFYFIEDSNGPDYKSNFCN